MGGHEVRWMFHSTAIVTDYGRAIERLQTIAGLRVMEYNENHAPEIGRRGGMTWIGDNSIEIGQPIVQSGGAARFVEQTGGGVHSVALHVRDLDASMAHVEACGVRVAARPRPQMFFTDPRDTGRVFFQWAMYELDFDPRFGATLPQFAREPLLGVIQHAFVGALVEDPLRSAETFARLLGTAVTFEEPDAGSGSPRAGVSLGDCTLALYAFSPGDSEDLWGREYGRPRTHLIGLRVDDLAVAKDALVEAGVTLVRADDSTIVIDPTATGSIQIALIDSLLPGDPRIQLSDGQQRPFP